MSLEVVPNYRGASLRGRVFMGRAIVTAPVIFSTAAGTGGPLLWNPNVSTSTAQYPSVTASILKVGFAVTTASGVAGALGFTGGIQGATAPASTTAIDTSANLNVGLSQYPSFMNVYRVGTVAAAGAWFMPFAMISTAAVTAVGDNVNWFDIGGAITVPPGGWLSVAASATLTSAVLQVALIWEELGVG